MILVPKEKGGVMLCNHTALAEPVFRVASPIIECLLARSSMSAQTPLVGHRRVSKRDGRKVQAFEEQGTDYDGSMATVASICLWRWRILSDSQSLKIKPTVDIFAAKVQRDNPTLLYNSRDGGIARGGGLLAPSAVLFRTDASGGPKALKT